MQKMFKTSLAGLTATAISVSSENLINNLEGP